MCGQPSGRRGELRLAKLSLTVSDSFLPDKRKAGKTEGTPGTLGFPPLIPPGISRSVNSPRISSFSSNCTQPALDLIACFNLLLLLILLSLPPLDPSLPCLLLLLLAPLHPSFSYRDVCKSREENWKRPRINLMRIIPALIAKPQRMVQASGWVV